MYSFQTETDYAAFDRFVEEHHGQYQQCSLWPQVKTAWKPYFFSAYEEDQLVLTCLVLERNLPLAGKLWYAPYGPVCDYKNGALQLEFANFMKQQMKQHHAFCFIIDPNVELIVDDEDREEGHQVHHLLTDIGYKLNTDLDSYTYKHPVQTMIPLRDADGNLIPAKDILKHCEKGVRYSVRVGTGRGLEAERHTWEELKQNPKYLEDFMSVMGDTSDRNSFVSRDLDYVTLLAETLKDYTDISLVYYDKALDTKLEQEREAEKEELARKLLTAPEKKIKGIKNELEVLESNTKNYKERMAETADYPEDARIVVAGGLTIRYGGYASCVFGGTKNIVRNQTRSSHYLNYLRICESIDEGMNFHDLGYVLCQNPTKLQADGTLPKLVPRENFEGICSFKLSFGAKFTQYIGEYILIGSPFRYWIYKELMPTAKHLKMKLVRLLRRK